MALRKPAPKPDPEIITWDTSKAMEEVPALRSLVAAAAAIRLDNQDMAAGRRKIGHLDWQFEAWRMYDTNGELRFAANRHAGAISRVRLYVAELDDQGDPGDVATDKRVAALARTILGGPAARAEWLRMLGAQFFVGGESWIVAESTPKADDDLWYIVGARQIRKSSRGDVYTVRRPEQLGGGWHKVTNKDLLMRAWTPHPDDFDLADSPTRAVLPTLREIERLTMLSFSQIDSRLISAGLLLLPQGIEFPNKDGNNGGVKAIMEMILEVAAAQLTGAGTAAGLVPILAEIPPGTGHDIQHLQFSSSLQNELKEKLDHAIRRLATGLDISPEEMLGQGKSNHWSANQIGEDGVKLFIEPVVTRICDAITRGYLKPMLDAMKVDSSKYTFWYDTSPLTTRPNRFEDALQLYNLGVISAQALRDAGNFSEDDNPDEKERQLQLAVEIAKLNPALLQTKAWADLLDLPPDEAAQQAQQAQQDAAQKQLEAQQVQQAGGEDPSMADNGGTAPDTPSGGPSPAQQGLTAAAALVPGAEQVVLRAFELAGGRLLDRNSRGRYADVPRHEIHTRVHPADRQHARRLLDGAFTHVPSLAGAYDMPADDLQHLLSEYCTELLVRGYAHETEYLREFLARARRTPLAAGGTFHPVA